MAVGVEGQMPTATQSAIGSLPWLSPPTNSHLKQLRQHTVSGLSHQQQKPLEIQENPPFLAGLKKWSRGELNPGPVTVPSFFYVRSLLATEAIFRLPSISQTTDGEPSYSKSPCVTLQCNDTGKSSQRRSASPRRHGRVNGAAARWLSPDEKIRQRERTQCD